MTTIAEIEALIDDGYTLTGFIAGQPGVYDDLEFVYRPVSVVDEIRSDLKRQQVAANKALRPEDRAVAAAILDIELAVSCVSAWNLTNGPGGDVVDGPPSVAAVIQHFPRYRLRRLQDIVCLGLASDPHPDGSTPDAAGSREEREKN